MFLYVDLQMASVKIEIDAVVVREKKDLILCSHKPKMSNCMTWNVDTPDMNIVVRASQPTRCKAFEACYRTKELKLHIQRHTH